MATIEYAYNAKMDEKKIILKVVKRTSKAEKNLEKLIFDNDLAKILSYKLGQLGFDVTMFDDVGSIKGISIHDVIKNVTNMVTIITIIILYILFFLSKFMYLPPI